MWDVNNVGGLVANSAREVSTMCGMHTFLLWFPPVPSLRSALVTQLHCLHPRHYTLLPSPAGR